MDLQKEFYVLQIFKKLLELSSIWQKSFWPYGFEKFYFSSAFLTSEFLQKWTLAAFLSLFSQSGHLDR